MYSRDACIHVCAMMVHVCIHSYGIIPLLLSHSCGDRTLSCMWLNHSNSGLRYAHKVLQCDLFIDKYSFTFLYNVEPIPMLNPYSCWTHIHVHEFGFYFPHTYTFVYRERSYTSAIMTYYTHTYSYLEKDGICDMTHWFICIFVTRVFICVAWSFICISFCIPMHVDALHFPHTDACI